MKLTVDGPGFSPDTTLTDDELVIGKDHYPLSKVVDVKAFTRPSSFVAPVYRVTFEDGTAANLTYDARQADRGSEIVSRLERAAAANTGATLSPAESGHTDAEHLLDLCLTRRMDAGANRSVLLGHFGVIADALDPGEEAHYAFIALLNYRGGRKSDGTYALAVTDRRLVTSQRNVFGLSVTDLPLDERTQASLAYDSRYGIITVERDGKSLVLAVRKDHAEEALEAIRATISGGLALREAEVASEGPVAPRPTASDPYEEVKKAKDLLDLGILTQEEFEEKKRQLLGL